MHNELPATILIVFAFVLFAIAAVWNPEPHRFRLVAAGLAAYVASILVGRF
jgi:hypothetical protein